MAWGAIAAAAGDALSRFISPAMEYYYSKKLMKYNYKLERESRQTSFGDTRKSLESAGYNPLLAVGDQAQGLTPSTTKIDVSPLELSSAYANYRNAETQQKAEEAQSERLANQTQIEKQNSALNAFTSTMGAFSQLKKDNAEADLMHSQTVGNNIQNLVNQEFLRDTALQNLENLKKQGKISDKQFEHYSEQIKTEQTKQTLNSALTGQANAERSRAIAGARNLNSATVGQELTNQRNQQISEWRSEYPGLDKFTYWVDRVSDAIPGISFFKGGNKTYNGSIFNNNSGR